MLAFDEEAIGVERRFAETHDLRFPRDLAGAFVAALIDALLEARRQYLTRKKREQRAAVNGVAGRCAVRAKSPVSDKVTCVECIAAVVDWQRAHGWS